MSTEDLIKSGYAGVLGNGNIVDRRDHPDAMPMEENEFMGIPKPLKTQKDLQKENDLHYYRLGISEGKSMFNKGSFIDGFSLGAMIVMAIWLLYNYYTGKGI